MDINKIKELAENNDACAQNELGVSYMEGDGVECNEAYAAYWFYRAAIQGNPAAIRNCGMCYLRGKGISKKIDGALLLLEWAYLRGADTVIQDILDEICDKSNIDIETLSSLAENGNAQAKWILGLCYDRGVCVDRDGQKAFELFIDSAKDNNPISLWFLACFFAKNPKPDLLRAKEYLDVVEEEAKKQVGVLGNDKIIKDIAYVNEQYQKECAFLLMKVIPECTEKGQPKDKYVQDMLDGKLFMKSLQLFEDFTERDESADNDFRGDVLEGYRSMINLPSFIEDEGGLKPVDIPMGGIDVLLLRRKVFCLSAIDYYKLERKLINPSEKLKKFGKYAVIITDVTEFLKRVRRAFDEYCKKDNACYCLDYGKVSYDVCFHKNINYDEFHKTKAYKWQNEFRISLDFTEGKFSEKLEKRITDYARFTFPGKIERDENPLSISDWMYFEIGDIRDICQCIDIEDLFNEKISSVLDKEPVTIEPYKSSRELRPTFYTCVYTKDMY